MSASAPSGQAPDARPPDPRRAEALGARLPPLLVAADRVAAAVAAGVHGRRRVGSGESFWQFRPFVTGDAIGRVDWRQSAKSGRGAPHGWYVRETEWEAAQTVFLWADASPSMRWRSRGVGVEKLERAQLLLLALASLLLRGGERVRLVGAPTLLSAGRAALDSIAGALARVPPDESFPLDQRIPPHARVVLFGDFLAPLEETRALVARLASVPVGGCLMQILDPAEALLPYAGRVRFEGMEREGETLIPRVEAVREAYTARLAAQQAGLAELCAAAGFGFSIHRTDHPPETALLALYAALTAK